MVLPITMRLFRTVLKRITVITTNPPLRMMRAHKKDLLFLFFNQRNSKMASFFKNVSIFKVEFR
jgi:hypothetical protein